MLFLAVVLVGSLGAARARQRPVGGEESVPFSRSHIVSLAYRPGTDLCWESFCGGTLLAPEGKVVISAAHCFFDGGGDLRAPVGEIVAAVHRHDLTEGPDEHECSALIEVEEVIKHPRYNADYAEDFDVAIVKLKDAPPCVADGTGRTSTAYLDPEYSQPGAVLRAEGWGATDKKARDYPEKLHEVYLDAMSNAECAALYPWECISDNMLCARAPGKDGCVGDSGGPLVYEDEDGTTMLVGITSWGPDGCAIWDEPGVWCRVSEVVDWIAEHVDVAAPGSVAPTLSKSPTVAPSAAPSATPTVSPAPTSLCACDQTLVLALTTDGFPEDVTWTLEAAEARAGCPVDVHVQACAASWSNASDGAGCVAVDGCPAAACDGDALGTWCCDRTDCSGDWFYCNAKVGGKLTAGASWSGGPYDAADASLTEVVTDEICDGMSYTFVMIDEYGDGICCDEGQGSFSLLLNGEALCTDAGVCSFGDYGAGIEMTFAAPAIKPDPKPTAPPSSAPTRGGACACDHTLVFHYYTDGFPDDTDWTLKAINAEQGCGAAGPWVMGGGGYFMSSAKYEDVVTDEICAGQKYEWTITDYYGDGICCDEGSGSYSLELDGTTIYASDGKFGFQDTFSFSGEGAPEDSEATCFSDPGVAIANCECHETCATCGFNDKPTKKKDCITCASGVAVTPYFDDGTGTCDAAPKGKGKKKKCTKKLKQKCKKSNKSKKCKPCNKKKGKKKKKKGN